MDLDTHRVVFAPVTRDQSRLFAGVARMLERRGMSCRFAAPSAESVSDIEDEWNPLITIPRDQAARGEPIDVPESIGAYDAWRSGTSGSSRQSSAEGALRFWRDYLEPFSTCTLIVWNGRGHVFVEAGVHEARQRGLDVLFMELGPLRQSPMTVAVSREGVNAAARFRRPEMLEQPLTPLESERLSRFRKTFRASVALRDGGEPYVFIPLQVDDDTQLFHYAPHFANQIEMLRAVVAAMPAELPLLIKLHPLAEATRGRVHYLPLLRPIDRIAPPDTDTLSLIADSVLVITTNSSAGVEALLLERPVLVLGEAGYGGGGFTHDYLGKSDLASLICDARQADSTAARADLRDRYLYELAFQELVHLERHPLRSPLCDDECERLAIRILELIDPISVGADWTPVFDEIHALQTGLREAVTAAVSAAGPTPLLVMSRFAAACLADRPTARTLLLDDWRNDRSVTMDGQTVCLLAPDLSAGQRAVVANQLRAAGARHVCDLTASLSRARCEFRTSRFNSLPRVMRDRLYAASDYWDYYIAQIGPAGELSPLKATQSDLIRELLASRAAESVLDFGCGDGVILHALAASTETPWTHLAGVDASEGMLNIARHRLRGHENVRLLAADARHPLPLADGEFDAVFTCGALQHVPADQLGELLDELHRVTRRTLVHWECCEAHTGTPGEHYTNPGASRAIHDAVLRRFGPVRMTVRDLRNVSQQNSLLTSYQLDAPLATILTLHAVGTPDPTCDSADYRGMFVTPRQLDRMIGELRLAGYRFATVSDLRRLADKPDHVPPKTIALTFDDGYASIYDVARPLLERHGVRASVFIATDFIGGSFAGNTRQGAGPPLATMNAEQIRSLRLAGWDIGAHSCSHPIFKTLSPQQAEHELAAGKAKLEALLGEPVTAFAFPYGEPELTYEPQHVRLAKRLGFTTVLSMRPDFVDPTRGTAVPGCNTVEWPRIGIGGDVAGGSILEQIARTHRASSGWPCVTVASGEVLKQRVRRAVKCCLDRGNVNIALYGAGRHTAKLLQHAPLWPLHVLGIVDDDVSLRGLTRYGLPIFSPSDITRLNPDALLISSDEYEEAIYQKLAPLEAGGVPVVRLYAKQA